MGVGYKPVCFCACSFMHGPRIQDSLIETQVEENSCVVVVFVVVDVVVVQPGLSVHEHCRPAPGSYDP